MKDKAVVLEDGQIDLGAVDLVSGLSILVFVLLALREDETGIGREQTLRDLALRFGA